MRDTTSIYPINRVEKIGFVREHLAPEKQNYTTEKVAEYPAVENGLLGAIRLPNNTFKANAGTEVTSDILFLQKRDTLVNDEPDWVHLDRDENGNEYNKYFIDHPEMVLGEMVMESSQFGHSLTCKPYEDRSLSDLLSEAVQNIHAEITEFDISEIGEIEDNSVPADPNVKNFSFTVVEDKIYYRQNSRMNPVDVSATAENRITDVYSHIIDEDRRLNAQRFEETFYQRKNPSEVNGATVEPKKEPQGITEEAMLNYMVQNPDFLQKFKVLLGVGN